MLKTKERSVVDSAANADITSSRESGILCHVSSLTHAMGIGDFGQASYDFIDSLAAAGQHYWQVLPLNPVGEGYSPYSSICSFAGEWMYISPTELVKDGLLKKNEIPAGKPSSKVGFKSLRSKRLKMLRLAFSRFKSNASFRKFLIENEHWLNSYLAFVIISQKQKSGTSYSQWPDDLRLCRPKAVANFVNAFPEEASFLQFLQFQFFKQWAAVKTYAEKAKIKIIGDLPIFVALESSDVWSNQKYFCLTKKSEAKFVAGVPPDYFNKDGQVWGNALYDWGQIEKSGFKFWIDRSQQMQKLYHLTRIDHFIGFYRYWEIPAAAKNAKKGRWRLVPGVKLFEALSKHLGGLPFIAEDLGKTTPEVFALRDKFNLPGMRVLHFGFGKTYASARYHLPYQYPENCIAYSGTHDNNTTRGWWDEAQRDARKKNSSFDFERLQTYYPHSSNEIARAVHLDLLKSKARIVIVPLQDLLGLGAQARMNIPGTATGNWDWRSPKNVASQNWSWLKAACRATGRT